MYSDTFAKLTDDQEIFVTSSASFTRLNFIFTLAIVFFIVLQIRIEMSKFRSGQGPLARLLFKNEQNFLMPFISVHSSEDYTSITYQRGFLIAMVLMFFTLFYGYRIPVEVRLSLLSRLFVIDVWYINNLISVKLFKKVLKEEFYWLIE